MSAGDGPARIVAARFGQAVAVRRGTGRIRAAAVALPWHFGDEVGQPVAGDCGARPPEPRGGRRGCPPWARCRQRRQRGLANSRKGRQSLWNVGAWPRPQQVSRQPSRIAISRRKPAGDDPERARFGSSARRHPGDGTKLRQAPGALGSGSVLPVSRRGTTRGSQVRKAKRGPLFHRERRAALLVARHCRARLARSPGPVGDHGHGRGRRDGGRPDCSARKLRIRPWAGRPSAY